MYASLLGISDALHLEIFHQPPIIEFFDRFLGSSKYEGRLVACKKKFRAVVFHEGHELVAAVVIGIIVVNQRRWDKALI